MIGEQFDTLLKLVVVGDSGVGKTNLLSRYANNEFSFQSKPTIGVQFETKSYKIEGRKIKVQIWDTAGQDRFRAITQAYYRGASGALLVFDLTKRSSFENLNKWYKQLKDNAQEDIVTIMVGNKSDLEQKRAVKQDEAIQFAQDNKMHYMQTSALNGTNVQQAFMTVIKQILQDSFANQTPSPQNSIKMPKNSNMSIKTAPSITKKEDKKDDKIVLNKQKQKKSSSEKKKKCCQ